MKEKFVDCILNDRLLEERVIGIRREIHRRPGLSGHEEETADLVCRWLERLGIPHERMLNGCAVVGILRGTAPGAEKGPVIGLRADMDALAIKEETGLEYASEIPGVMHACGHDAHTAVLLGTAIKLKELQAQLKGTVKFFFQPAEETTGGAKPMIDAGCLENPHVDCVVGLHVEPALETGQIGIRYGKMMAASDMIDLIIRGKGAHGAHPDQGVDAILVAASVLNAVQTVVSRRISPTEAAVCSFGKIQGGTVRNQIADEVVLQGILRTLDPYHRKFVREQVGTIARSVAEAMGAEIEYRVEESYGPTINDEWVTGLVEGVAADTVGREKVILEQEPDLGTEDFSFFTQARPSCFFHLGCRKPEAEAGKEDAVLHNSRFSLDEDCLKYGIAMQTGNVLSLMENWK